MNYYFLIPFVAYTINSAFSLYVLFLDPRRKINRVFAIGFLFVAAWNLAEGMMRSRDNYGEAIFWSRVMLSAVFFIPSFILYFSFVFTKHSFSEKVSSILLIFTPPFLFSAFLVPYIYRDIVMTPSGYDYVPGPLFGLFSLLYLAVCLVALFIFYRKYFTTSSKSEKSIFLVILIGFAIPVLLGLFTNLFSRMLGISVPRLGSVFSVFVSLSFFYAIRRHQFLVLPISERKEEGLPTFTLEKGYSYIAKEEVPEKSYHIFCDLVSHGIHGIVIARTHPSKTKAVMGLEKTPVFWLSSVKGEGNLEPHDLSKVLFIVSSFLKESPDSVVFLEGIEYLIYNNNFDSILKFLYVLDDCITFYHSRLILSINPKALSPKEMTLMEREMIIL